MYYIKLIPTNELLFCCKGKSGPNATFNLIFPELGWPWVGELVSFIILVIFVCFPAPQFLKSRTPYLVLYAERCKCCDVIKFINSVVRPMFIFGATRNSSLRRRKCPVQPGRPTFSTSWPARWTYLSPWKTVLTIADAWASCGGFRVAVCGGILLRSIRFTRTPSY